MADAGTCAHHLHIPRAGAALVAQAVAVHDCAGAHESDNFHVGMGMRGKARLRGDAVIVPDAQGAPAHPGRIVIIGKAEMVSGVQPAMLRMGQFGEWSYFDHVGVPPRRGDAAGMDRKWAMRREVQE